MNDSKLLDQIPENVTVISGQSLLSRRHMPVPPSLTAAIRKPQDPVLLYEILREEYPEEHPLQLLSGTECRELTLADLRTGDYTLSEADYLIVPPLPEQYAFETFQNTVAILRGPHGCPWDKKQTHQSLRDDLLQEVYELLDGLDQANRDMTMEELGDVLLHILLQAQIGVDNGEFTMGDVISHINDKIIYRHQHVFGNPEDIAPDQVMLRWEQIKQKEREKQHKKGGLLDGISRSMPALSMAFSYQKRAAKAGFEWKDAEDIWDKLAEEMEELVYADTPQQKEEELGDLLFCVVSLARWYQVDPETALRMSNLKFRERIHYVEEQGAENGKDLFEMTDKEKEEYWQEYKEAKLAEQNDETDLLYL